MNFFKKLFFTIIIIVIVVIGVITFMGYNMYKSAINKSSIAEKIAEIKSRKV